MNIAAYIEKLVRIDKALDEIYHKISTHFGLSDQASWILYTLTRTTETLTQQDLCRMGHLSKQTVNSVISSFAENGLVELAPLLGTKKSKRIIVTEAGKELALHTTDKLYEAEKNAFSRFSEDELKAYLDIETRFAKYLREEAEKLYQ